MKNKSPDKDTERTKARPGAIQRSKSGHRAEKGSAKTRTKVDKGRIQSEQQADRMRTKRRQEADPERTHTGQKSSQRAGACQTHTHTTDAQRTQEPGKGGHHAKRYMADAAWQNSMAKRAHGGQGLEAPSKRTCTRRGSSMSSN